MEPIKCLRSGCNNSTPLVKTGVFRGQPSPHFKGYCRSCIKEYGFCERCHTHLIYTKSAIFNSQHKIIRYINACYVCDDYLSDFWY